MPRKRVHGHIKKNDVLDFSKLNGMQDYFLRNGLCLSGCEAELSFSPDDLMTARRLWVLHKNELMSRQDLKNPGWRPWAYFRFECNIEPATFKYGERLAYLREHKLLEPWEIALLDSQQT
jgi:hypothetical protein